MPNVVVNTMCPNCAIRNEKAETKEAKTEKKNKNDEWVSSCLEHGAPQENVCQM